MQEDLHTELIIKEEWEYMNTEEYSADNTIKVKEEVTEETEDPLLVTVQPGNILNIVILYVDNMGNIDHNIFIIEILFSPINTRLPL